MFRITLGLAILLLPMIAPFVQASHQPPECFGESGYARSEEECAFGACVNHIQAPATGIFCKPQDCEDVEERISRLQGRLRALHQLHRERLAEAAQAGQDRDAARDALWGADGEIAGYFKSMGSVAAGYATKTWKTVWEVVQAVDDPLDWSTGKVKDRVYEDMTKKHGIPPKTAEKAMETVARVTAIADYIEQTDKTSSAVRVFYEKRLEAERLEKEANEIADEMNSIAAEISRLRTVCLDQPPGTPTPTPSTPSATPTPSTPTAVTPTSVSPTAAATPTTTSTQTSPPGTPSPVVSPGLPPEDPPEGAGAFPPGSEAPRDPVAERFSPLQTTNVVAERGLDFVANLRDDDGDLSHVRWRVDGVEVKNDTSPYGFVDSSRLRVEFTEGDHDIEAIVYDLRRDDAHTGRAAWRVHASAPPFFIAGTDPDDISDADLLRAALALEALPGIARGVRASYVERGLPSLEPLVDDGALANETVESLLVRMRAAVAEMNSSAPRADELVELSLAAGLLLGVSSEDEVFTGYRKVSIDPAVKAAPAENATRLALLALSGDDGTAQARAKEVLARVSETSSVDVRLELPAASPPIKRWLIVPANAEIGRYVARVDAGATARVVPGAYDVYVEGEDGQTRLLVAAARIDGGPIRGYDEFTLPPALKDGLDLGGGWWGLVPPGADGDARVAWATDINATLAAPPGSYDIVYAPEGKLERVLLAAAVPEFPTPTTAGAPASGDRETGFSWAPLVLAATVSAALLTWRRRAR